MSKNTRKVIKSFILVCASVLAFVIGAGTLNTHAADNNDIDSWMPDKQLQQDVVDELQDGNWSDDPADVDSTGDNETLYNKPVDGPVNQPSDITKNDVKNMVYFQDFGQGRTKEHQVHSLQGMQYATHLQYFDIYDGGHVKGEGDEPYFVPYMMDIPQGEFDFLGNNPHLDSLRVSFQSHMTDCNFASNLHHLKWCYLYFDNITDYSPLQNSWKDSPELRTSHSGDNKDHRSTGAYLGDTESVPTQIAFTGGKYTQTTNIFDAQGNKIPIEPYCAKGEGISSPWAFYLGITDPLYQDADGTVNPSDKFQINWTSTGVSGWLLSKSADNPDWYNPNNQTPVPSGMPSDVVTMQNYVAPPQVLVHYLDENGKQIDLTQSYPFKDAPFTYDVGKGTSYYRPNIGQFTLDTSKLPTNTSGTLTASPTAMVNVNYYYKNPTPTPKTYTIKVYYKDDAGKEIATEKELTGKTGEKYSVDKPDSINGLPFEKSSAPLTGTFGDSTPTSITLTYGNPTPNNPVNPNKPTTPSKPASPNKPNNPEIPQNPNNPAVGNDGVQKHSKVYAMKALNLYRKSNLTGKVKHFKKVRRTKRPRFVVKQIVRNPSGSVRYYVKQLNVHRYGWISGNTRLTQNNYYQPRNRSIKFRILNRKGLNSYKKLTLHMKAKHYKFNTIFKARRIRKDGLQTRFQLTNGMYVSTRKNFVIFK